MSAPSQLADSSGLRAMAAVLSTLHKRGSLSRDEMQHANSPSDNRSNSHPIKHESVNQSNKQATVLSLINQLKDVIGLDEDSHERAVSMALDWNHSKADNLTVDRSNTPSLSQSTHWPSNSSLNSFVSTPRSVSSGSEHPMSELTEAHHQSSDRSINQDHEETEDDQPLRQPVSKRPNKQTGKNGRSLRSSSRSKAKNHSSKVATTKKGQTQCQ